MDLHPSSSPVKAGTTLNARWNPARSLESAASCRAIRELGMHLARAGFINRFGRLEIDDDKSRTLAELALGRSIDVADASHFLGGRETTAALLETGAATAIEEGRFSLSFEVLSDGKAMAILPFLDSSTEVPADSVYAGSDTWLLRDHAWKYGLRGKRALDLGTGTGLVAAFLTSRYETVIATDLNHRATLTAQLSRELLPESARSRMHVVTNDSAAGLLARSFDFVCVNAPWVPSSRAGGRIYAEGGETGFELPRRFISDGVELLAPHGIFLGLCAELNFRDGANPLRDLIEGFEHRGFEARIDPTPSTHPFFSATDATAETLPGLLDARHVTVVVRRL